MHRRTIARLWNASQFHCGGCGAQVLFDEAVFDAGRFQQDVARQLDEVDRTIRDLESEVQLLKRRLRD
ncbi:MAG: hypothetical protein A3E78_11805 [Alphaproteobacteria bacterium RIFCSPHIGHO2_12_FULL_63_12]|nr:MAG: hypothetical protein A3E78_11805 [Alphaproteobacteria bacterium RIFCSPHIGHO2_12_FULL_63_12]